MTDMVRYSKVENKNKREIVLLKGNPCVWGRCSFCDYILDNSTDTASMVALNERVLSNITGEFGVLEVINSGSVFELPQETLSQIQTIVREKKIHRLFFESHWSYRKRLQEIRDIFEETEVIFKCGIETFDEDFRNRVLKKGAVFSSPQEVADYFSSICLMVGIQGQTKEMIAKDIEYLQQYFPYGCINVYINNGTNIKADPQLIQWFYDTYRYLEQNPSIEVLWNNTDFGVGEVIEQ